MSRDLKYIGMDVHKEAVVIAVRKGTGQLVMESIVETKASSFTALARRTVMGISRQLSAIGNPSEARLRGACCPSYPSSMVRVTSFISLISVITIA